MDRKFKRIGPCKIGSKNKNENKLVDEKEVTATSEISSVLRPLSLPPSG
jgi:hypothetical protein